MSGRNGKMTPAMIIFPLILELAIFHPLIATATYQPFPDFNPIIRDPDIRETIRSLEHYLFQNYSTHIRPRLDQSESVLVNFYIGLRQVIDVDVKAQQMTLFLWHRQTWTDQFLVWDPEQFANVTELFVNPGLIWQPDVIYQNSVTGLEDLEQTSPIKILLMWNGLVNFYRPTIQSTTCEMQVRYFPYDIQHCSFNIGSWMLHENQVDIHVFAYDSGSLSGYGFIEHHEWALLEHTVLREEVTIDVTLVGQQNRLVYPYLQFIFLFERKPEFFEKNVIIPTALICALSTVTFLLPNESGEKITFSVTVFLTLCVNLLVVTNHVPASSESFPIIGHYYLACITIVAISIFMTTVVLSFHFKGEHVSLSPIPRVVKKVMFNYVAPLLGFEANKSINRLYGKVAAKKKRNRNHRTTRRTHKFSTFETTRTKSSFSLSAYQQNSAILLSSTKLNAKPAKVPHEFQLKAILTTLLKVETHLRDATMENISKHQRNILAEEWIILSRVVDRLSAVAYGITTTVFTIYFVHSMKNKPLHHLPDPYFVNKTGDTDYFAF